MLANHKQQIKHLDYIFNTHTHTHTQTYIYMSRRHVQDTCVEHKIIQLKKMEIYTSENDIPCVERDL